MAAYELKYTAEEIDGILESVDEKTIYGDATQSKHGLMSATDKAKLDSLPTSQQINASLSGKVDKVDGKGLSTYDYDKTAKDKVDAIPADPKYTDTVYDDTALAGRVSTIEGKESGWDAKQDAINDLDTIRSGATAGASAIPMPSGGSVGQVLKKTADGTEWANESGGGGTSDYSSLTNKPQINSVTLSGNKSLSDLGIAAAADIPTVPTKLSEFTDDLGTSPTHSHSQYLTSHQDITGKADKVSSATNGNFAALDSNGNLTDSGHKHSEYLTSHQDISGKADKATTLAGYGITDAKIDNGVITLGSNTITPLTSHQSLTNYVQKSQTAGLLKNDGTVDQTQYGTYSKPSNGIPASDLESGVIPTVPVQDVTVGGASVVSNGTAVIPAIPDVSGKADKVLVATTEPSGGMLPNVLYDFGELSGNTTFTLATPADNTIANHYYFTFDTPSTAPTITWPQAITSWFGGSAPTISASKHYEISVLNGIAVAMEV